MHTGTIEKPLWVANIGVRNKSGELVYLTMVITPGNGPVLLGRNWLKEVQLDRKRIFPTFLSASGKTGGYGSGRRNEDWPQWSR